MRNWISGICIGLGILLGGGVLASSGSAEIYEILALSAVAVLFVALGLEIYRGGRIRHF